MRLKLLQENTGRLAGLRLLVIALVVGGVGCGNAVDRGNGAAPSLAQLAERFEQLDTNQDGVLSPRELPRRRLFRRLDVNGDNQITRAEARAVLSGGTEAPPQSVPTQTTDPITVAYAAFAGTDPNQTSLDIYPLPAATAAPVLVYVHGGSWMNGDKANVGQKPEFFHSNGYLLVSINYRLIPEVNYPENVQDVARAIAWVQDNIAEYGGDPNQIVVMGHSAGAHLAGLVATDERYLMAVGQSLSILSGVILLDGAVYDLPLMMQNPGPQREQLYRAVFGDDPTVWAQASPVTHIAPNQAIPPFLLVYANNNRRKAAQTQTLATALQAAKVPVQVVAAPEETHQSVNQTLGSPDNPATGAVQQFLQAL